MTEKEKIIRQLEIFHRAAKFLGSQGMGVLAFTSAGEDILTTEAGIKFDDVIYIVANLAKNHPREFDLALDMKDHINQDQNAAPNITVH